MKLSVIICLYNTERILLRECLESLGRALPAPQEREIIIIDDGSDNDYGDMAKDHLAKYEKQKRAGTLAARLRGIELAQGEYIAFVDSDDTVGFNYYPPMLKRADEGADIVFNSWAFRTEGTRYVCREDDTVSGSISSEDPLATYFSRKGVQHSYYVLWNKIYRSDILKEAARELSSCDLPHPFCFSEDTLINLFAFDRAKKVVGIAEGYYFYRIHRDQTVNVTSKQKLLYQIDCMSYTLRKCKEKVANRTDRASIEKNIAAWRDLMSRSHFANARQGGYTDIYPYIKEKYGIPELRMPKMRDGRIYERVKLLPDSAEKIEAALLSICERGGPVRVRKPKREGYAELLLISLSSIGRIIEYRRDYPGLPREKIPLIKRVIFNPIVRRMGALLFKKGSRARAFLKRFI